MALIKCKECGQMISDKATKCPKCGCPNQKDMKQYQESAAANAPTYYEEESRSNKWLYGIVVLLVAAITGGGYWWYCQSKGNQEIRQFVAQFAKAVETNDNQAIQKFYPDAGDADSLQFTFEDKTIKIETDENEWKVFIAKDKEIIIAQNADNTFYIKDSRGLFVYPDSLFLMAKGTGWYDTSLTDKQNSERLKDTDFICWLSNRVKKEIQSKVKITKATSTKGAGSSPDNLPYGTIIGDTHCIVTITNYNDYQIAGNEYRIQAREKMKWYSGNASFSWEPEEQVYGETKILSGKPIPANESVSYSWKGNGYYIMELSSLDNFELEASIIFTPQFEKSAMKAYQFNGKEFEEYLAEKRKP